MKELISIQSELKAPKDLFNKFGNYSYRSAESILEALKPLLHKQNCILTISDELVNIGSRFYVKATCTLTNAENQTITTSAYAREEEAKKGYDSSQITGSASSYARKYALNGLFCIDDTKDPDATNTHDVDTKQPKQEAPKTVTPQKIQAAVAIEEMNKAKDIKSLAIIWGKYKDTVDNLKTFTDAKDKRKSELSAQ